jgi:diacylglycerol kinase (ATP)
LKNAALIYNPTAGGKSSRREREIHLAAKALESQGIAAELFPTSAPGVGRQLARQAIEKGAELILACGGDGTLNEVANGVAPGETSFAILPGGTANVFARELGVALNPARAASQLSRWTPRRIALGRATWQEVGTGEPRARYFLCLAGVGFDAYIIHKLSRKFANDFGVFAYGWEGLRQVFRYHFPTFGCTANGHTTRGTFAVMQRTSRYAGWLRLAPGASIFQDRLTLCLFQSSHRGRYLAYAAAILARRHTRLRDVAMAQTSKVECAAEGGETVYFELDGELVGQLPVTFDVVPDALTLLAP